METADKAFVQYHGRAVVECDKIAKLLGEIEKPGSAFHPSWGNVGDMQFVAMTLASLAKQIARK